MKSTRATLLLTGLTLLSAALTANADEALRVEFDADPGFEAMPGWLGNPSDAPRVDLADGVASFIVPEPDRGMKWLLPLDPVDIGLFPWLVLRYRTHNYDPAKPDYLVYVHTDKKGEGTRLLRGDEIDADGQWHLVAINLVELEAGSLADQIAFQTQATADGGGRLEVDFFAFADVPPEGAEGVMTEIGPDEVTLIETRDAGIFKAEPTWLSNPADAPGAETTPEGVRFQVPQAGRGMKWSFAPAAPVEGASWLSVRYRAQGMRRNTDYFIYLAGAPGGRAEREQYCIPLNDVASDGAWQVAVGRVEVDPITAMAIQVQAAEPGASVELAHLRFSSHRPPKLIADTLPMKADAEPPDFRALQVPVGDVPLAQLCKALGYDDTLPAGKLTVCEVPFGVPDSVVRTTLKGDDQIAIPAEGSAAEVFLLLGLRATAMEEPSYGGGRLNAVTHPHRFVVRMEYDQGAADEAFPLRLASGEHEIRQGLDVYVVHPDAGRRLKTARLLDTMDRGAIAVLAATAFGPERLLRPDLRRERPAPVRVAQARSALAGPTEITLEEGVVHVRGQRLSATFDADNCMALTELSSGYLGAKAFPVEPQPLFGLAINGTQVAPEAFELGDCKVGDHALRATYLCRGEERRATVSLSLTGQADGSVLLRVQVRNDAEGHADVVLTAPQLGALQLTSEPDDLWYLFPRCGAIVSNRPMNLSAHYGGGFPMQVMSAFVPGLGGGFYLMTKDTTAECYRSYHLAKRDGAVSMSVKYLQAPVGPGETFEGVPTELGAHGGDWHQALAIYRRWADTWYQPATPRKQWFREVFNFRQQFLHFALPSKSGLFDPEAEAFHFEEVLARDAEMFGGIDYLHLFDWGWSEKSGRCGDYDHYDQLGSLEKFREAVQATQAGGLPVGLYIEGMLVSPQAEIAEQAKQWEMRREDGTPNPAFAPSMNMCSNHPGWRAYVAGVYGRVQKEVGNRGFYIDQYGFANLGKVCWREDHPHPRPAGPTYGELLTTLAVREAIEPTTALYTEETPCDVTSQYQDGSFTYNIRRADDRTSPTHLNLFRFVFPDFKTIEIIVCDRPLGTNQEAVKRVFFNGEAIWLEGIPDYWFDARVRALLARTHRILRENRDAFTSLSPTPLVPTLAGDLYANEFPCERGTLWTLYNTGYATYRGPVIEVPHVPGARYVDLWNDRELTPSIEGDSAVINLELPPRDVGCIAQWR